jgi:hypothetical protein
VRLVFGFSGRYIPLGRDFEAVVSIGFWVHASACLSVPVRRWDDSTQSIGAGFRWFLFHCMRIYDPAVGAIFFSISWFYLSFGNYSLYTTRLFEEGSAYL